MFNRRHSAGHDAIILVLATCCLIGFTFAPYRDAFPMALLGFLVFWGVQFFVLPVRLKTSHLICPLNIAQLLFFLQLVIVPMIMVFSGVSKGLLPSLPSEAAVNLGFIVQLVSYLSFILGYMWKEGSKSAVRSGSEKAAAPRFLPRGAGYWLLAGFVVIGLVGFSLKFASLGAYLNYVFAPSLYTIEPETDVTTLKTAASTFMRPFLAFGIAFGWAMWVDRRVSRKPGRSLILVTAAAILAIVFINLSYSFNRASILVPLAGIVGVFSARVRRIPNFVLIGAGLVVFGGALVLGEYRAVRWSATDTTVQELGKRVTVGEWIQLYASAPQFSGFLLESLHYGDEPKWGATLIASALSPVPVLGKDFRARSGAELYNRLIYGSIPSSDQVLPFGAEVFVNFHFMGVLLGFFVLGGAMGRLQRGYQRAPNSFESYCCFFVAVWVAFLIVGSLAVLSQMIVFFFWPIYLYALVRWIMNPGTTRAGVTYGRVAVEVREHQGIQLRTSHQD